jgi:hypothetical protein
MLFGGRSLTIELLSRYIYFYLEIMQPNAERLSYLYQMAQMVKRHEDAWKPGSSNVRILALLPCFALPGGFANAFSKIVPAERVHAQRPCSDDFDRVRKGAPDSREHIQHSNQALQHGFQAS